MRLSWNEIRARAAKFAVDWADAGYEKGETQSFYNAFFDIFGVRRRSVARYEEHVKRLDNSSGFIDLFWPGVLLVEQKSEGKDLQVAEAQASNYFDALAERDRPRFQLVCDFKTFRLRDLDAGEMTQFDLADLPKHVEKFGFIIGVARRTFRDQDPANIEASELMGRIHDALKESGFAGHDLELLLVRMVFLLFADDTGIFEPRGIFQELVEERTAEDGSDTGLWLARLFDVLNTPEDQRQKHLDEDLTRFPYVNGDLFRERLRIADFSSAMRAMLIDACGFDWSAISPAIFGALFQSVMAPAERRAQGAHYTTEKNILKVIEPLFLDDLRAEFKRLKARRDTRRRIELGRFQARLGKLRLLDPACGCGNFLIIAYRELRRLEIEVIREVRAAADPDQFAIAPLLSMIDVDQFYGIEIDEFPTRIAETALWMMDHVMNNALSLEFGQSYVRIPLKSSPHIRHADALEMDWAELLRPDQCSYVLGNPPFGGAKYQSPAQRAQVRRIAALGGSGGTLDYVTAWFIKAGEYIRHSGPPGNGAAIGFVATNSITQGEQVAQLWPLLFGRLELEIAFAHRTFAWGSDARGVAHVHVVIVGLVERDDAPALRRLFTYDDLKGDPDESRHAALSPYLFDSGGLVDPRLVVATARQPINRLPKLIIGSKPIDGGNYILTPEEGAKLIRECPDAAPFVRPYVGSREFLQGGNRHILWLGDAPLGVLKHSVLRDRVRAVRTLRQASRSKPTRELADTPTLYHVNVIPNAPFLVIPKVSSERREYVPIGWLEPPTVPSDLVFVLQGATKPIFALLTSAMHMAWLRHIGGRLESRYRYSIGLVYNTFPLPPASDEQLGKLEPLAEAILGARAEHSDATLADLYDPDLMPADLRLAHRKLDRAVDRLYRSRLPFASERERVEHLLVRYEALQAPLVVKDTPRPKRRRRKSPKSA